MREVGGYLASRLNSVADGSKLYEPSELVNMEHIRASKPAEILGATALYNMLRSYILDTCNINDLDSMHSALGDTLKLDGHWNALVGADSDVTANQLSQSIHHETPPPLTMYLESTESNPWDDDIWADYQTFNFTPYRVFSNPPNSRPPKCLADFHGEQDRIELNDDETWMLWQDLTVAVRARELAAAFPTMKGGVRTFAPFKGSLCDNTLQKQPNPYFYG